MRVAIDKSWSSVLQTLPETGMGFQIVESAQERGTAARIVLNAQFLQALPPVEHRVAEKAPELAGWASVFRQPAKIGMVRVLSPAEARDRGYLIASKRMAGAGPANQAPITPSGPKEPFRRYSAFPNDHRINSDGSVLPGTYVTTRKDGETNVRTGMDAVRRYALPNPDPAIYLFEIVPPSVVPVRRGVVAPQFGQPGGGVEIILEDGAPIGSAQGRTEIPAGP